MANKLETRTIKVLIDETDLNRKLEKDIALSEKLTKKLTTLPSGSEQWKAVDQQLKNVNARIKQYNDVLAGKVGPSENMLIQRQKELNRQLKQMPIELRKASMQAKELEQIATVLSKIKNEQRQVNAGLNQMNAKQGGFFTSLKTGIASVFGGNLVTKAFDAVKSFIVDGIAYSKQLGKSAANLSSLTGLTGVNLEFLKRQAKELSQSTVEGNIRITKSAEAIQNAYTVVGSQRPELLKSKEALGEVTKNALILAEAAQTDLDTAVKGVTTTLNQFEMEGKESGRIINVLAAGSKEGAGDVNYLAVALEKSGTAMKFSNLVLEEGVGLIETLAPKFSSPEMAGTQLKNTLLKLEAAADKNLRPSIVGLIPALEHLKAMNMDTAEMVQFFGTENINTATILRDSIPEIQRYTAAVTGTSVALEQAAINTDTEAAKSEQARNKRMNAAASWGKILTPAITAAEFALGHYLEKTAELIEGETPLTNSIRSTKAEFNAEMKVLMDANISMEQRSQLITDINKKYGEYLPFLIDEKTSYYELGHALESANNSLDKRIMLMMKEEVIGRKTKEIADSYEVEMLTLKQIEKLKQEGVKEDDMRMKTFRLVLQQEADKRNGYLKDISDVGEMVDKEMENLRRQQKKVDGIGSTLNPGKLPSDLDAEKQIEATQARLDNLNKTVAEQTTNASKLTLGALEEQLKAYQDELKETEIGSRRFFELNALIAKKTKEIEKATSKGKSPEEIAKEKEAQFRHQEKVEQDYWNNVFDFQERGIAMDGQMASEKVLGMLKIKETADKVQDSLKKASKEVQDEIAKNALAEVQARHAVLQKAISDENASLAERLAALEELKQAELAALTITDETRAELAKQGITEEQYFAQQRLQIEQNHAQQVEDIRRESIQKQVEAMAEYATQATGIYNSLNQVISNGEQGKIDQFHKDRDSELEELEKQHERKLISDAAYEAKKKSINDKYRSQEAAIKKRQFERQKIADMIQTTINTFVAVSKVLANPILAGIVGAAGAAQVAAIASQRVPEFGKGVDLTGIGRSHANGGLPIIDPVTGRPVAEVEEGEVILSKNTAKNNRFLIDKLLYSSLYNNGQQVDISGQVPKFNFSNITKAAPMFQQGALVGSNIRPVSDTTLPPSLPSVPSASNYNAADQDMKALMVQQNQLLVQLLNRWNHGVKAFYGDAEVRKITERQTDFSTADGTADLN